MPELRNLIVVPGHAPFQEFVREVPNQPWEDRWWALQDFQRGEPPAYIEHVKAGVAELSADIDSAMLSFSGGRTRLEGGHWSEAITYNALASHFCYWEANTFRRRRMAGQIALENFARDSLENLENSIDIFVARTCEFPRRITIVGWKFKEERFLFHTRSLGISKRIVRYVGVNNPENLEAACAGEAETLNLYRKDPLAMGQVLTAKRESRNPFGVARPPNSV